MKTHITLWLCCCICWFSLGQSVTELEYFFNTDPGFGNATTLTPNANAGDLTQSFDLTLPTDATGFNTLYVRAKDNTNTWSLYANAIVFIIDTDNGNSSATELTAAEYFINTDPGFGNATALPVDPNTGTLIQSFAIPIGTNLDGFNTLYIRTQDDLGVWSLYDNVKFFVTEAQGTGATEITALEYFIDTDPGFGNATNATINSNTGALSQSIAIPLGDLDEGFHNLYLRTQDDLGEWSLYDKRLFFVAPEQAISPITAAEYFYDFDPGLGNGTSAALQPTGNLDEFTIDLSTVDISCDFHDFYIRLINEDGSWSLYDYGLEVEVFDNQNPTIVVFDDITVALDATGNGSITIDDVNNGTFDDCELISVVMDPVTASYTCADLGIQTVTITATDAEDKVSTLEVDINVIDTVDPVTLGQNITVQLDTNGEATILASQVDNGSSDNCTVANLSVDINSFTCADLGDNTITLTATDQSGNTNSTSVLVTVEDTTNPVAIAQNLTVQLDAAGNATITADDIDQSTDNCTIVTSSVDISSFTCSNIGANTVTLTVQDQSGNIDDTTATITIEDSIDPSVVTQNITVQLDTNGEATITPDQIDNGSTDNCTIASLALDTSTFTCDDIGTFDVTLTATDQSGNSSSETATVTIEDTIDPTISVQNITVALDANGEVTVDPFDLNNNSSDNCVLDLFLDTDFFTCDDLGVNSVSVTAADGSGNSVSTSATITVIDDLDPTAIGQDITIDLAGQPSVSIVADDVDNGSNDNCAFTLSLDQDTFTDPGDYPVTLTATDSANNTNSVIVIVTVTDSTLDINSFELSFDELRVYPNPVTDKLRFKTVATIDSIAIVDINGKIITTRAVHEYVVDVSTLSNGIYFIKFFSGSKQLVKRFIKK